MRPKEPAAEKRLLHLISLMSSDLFLLNFQLSVRETLRSMSRYFPPVGRRGWSYAEVGGRGSDMNEHVQSPRSSLPGKHKGFAGERGKEGCIKLTDI